MAPKLRIVAWTPPRKEKKSMDPKPPLTIGDISTELEKAQQWLEREVKEIDTDLVTGTMPAGQYRLRLGKSGDVVTRIGQVRHGRQPDWRPGCTRLVPTGETCVVVRTKDGKLGFLMVGRRIGVRLYRSTGDRHTVIASAPTWAASTRPTGVVSADGSRRDRSLAPQQGDPELWDLWCQEIDSLASSVWVQAHHKAKEESP
jgi:hypothetical protein